MLFIWNSPWSIQRLANSRPSPPWRRIRIAAASIQPTVQMNAVP